jgi:hypothetical protein
MGGVPVEPPGIEMPDIADDELRVVVFGPNPTSLSPRAIRK